MAIVIEQAKDGDATEIAAVHRRSAVLAYAEIFPKDATPPTVDELADGWRTIIGGPGQVVVARLNDVIVGAVAVHPAPDVPTGQLLARLYVDPEHWQAGLGSSLHDHVVSEARRRPGAMGLNLWVLEDNTIARRLYERKGWTLVPGRYLANEPPEIRDVLYQLNF